MLLFNHNITNFFHFPSLLHKEQKQAIICLFFCFTKRKSEEFKAKLRNLDYFYDILNCFLKLPFEKTRENKRKQEKNRD